MDKRAYARGLLLVLAAACSSQKESDVESKSTLATPVTPPTSVPQPGPSAPPPVQRRIGRPLTTDTTGFAMVDRMDVAADQSESAHKYSIDSPTALPLRSFDLGAKRGEFFDDGRATAESETFEVRVVPNQDHILIKAYDPAATGQKVSVFIDGAPAADWILPDVVDGEYGEASYPLKGSFIGARSKVTFRFESPPDSPPVNSYYYWMFGKPDRKLEKPVATTLTGLSLMDHLDVGTDADEKTHAYVMEKQAYAVTREFWWPNDGLPFLENGRGTKSAESFRMRVKPGADHVLVKAFDTLSKDQVIRVLVDGKLVGSWSPPNTAARYGESSFQIPASFIGSSNSAEIRLEFVSGSTDMNSFYYWLYSVPAKQSHSESAPTRASL